MNEVKQGQSLKLFTIVKVVFFCKKNLCKTGVNNSKSTIGKQKKITFSNFHYFFKLKLELLYEEAVT